VPLLMATNAVHWEEDILLILLSLSLYDIFV